MAEQELEINFRLDQDGRTTFDGAQGSLDYTPKVSQCTLPPNDLLDEWLLDCEIADSGLMPRTFWLAHDAKPRFALEQLAQAVFQYHTQGVVFDPATSGAEWWVQLRPSPDVTGRYTMHGDPTENDGISFHWDKDEDLRLLCGAHVHPHLSTVTYLTDLGAPTLVADFRVHTMTGEWLPHNDNDTKALICWPQTGKHLSFDGRYLHAAPSDLMEPGQFAQQTKLPDNATKQERRRRRRVTFLVNVWLNYRPFNVNPFPETMLDKMSQTTTHPVSLSAASNGAIATVQTKESKDNLVDFEWPMGNCDSGEFIQARLPLERVRQGGTLRIEWNDAKLVRRTTEKRATDEEVNDAKRQKTEDSTAE